MSVVISRLSYMLAILLIFCLFLFLNGCKKPLTNLSELNQAEKGLSVEEIRKKGIIRIGVFADKPPFTYLDENGEYQGFDIDIAKKIVKDLLGDENKVLFMNAEAGKRVDMLMNNQVDMVIANFTITPEREKLVDFARPYLKVGLGVISRRDQQVTEIDQLKGETVLVPKGTTAESFFLFHKPDVKLMTFETNQEMYHALLEGKANLLAHDNLIALAWLKDHPEYTLGISTMTKQEMIAPAVKKGNESLLNWLNAEIDNLNRSGFIEQAYEKNLKPFFGNQVSAIDLLIKN